MKNEITRCQSNTWQTWHIGSQINGFWKLPHWGSNGKKRAGVESSIQLHQRKWYICRLSYCKHKKCNVNLESTSDSYNRQNKFCATLEDEIWKRTYCLVYRRELLSFDSWVKANYGRTFTHTWPLADKHVRSKLAKHLFRVSDAS